MPLSDYLEVSDRRLRRLAARSGITLERLNALASGAEPTGLELSRISNALDVGVTDLLRTSVEPQGAAFRFRSVLGVSHQGRELRQRTVSEIAARIDGIHEIVASTPWAHRGWPAPEAIRSDPFALAAWFRESCFARDHVSPILDLAEAVGSCLNVITVVLRRSAVDGVCAVVGRVPYIFIRAQFKPRMLFTLAHELGHLLAHAGDSDFASVDPARSVGRLVPNREEERFANEFATELLMPPQGVGIALRNIRETLRLRDPEVGDIEILFLAHLFGVSFEVSARRCEQLDLLPRGGASALIQHISTHFVSPERRAASAGIPARVDARFPSVSDNVLRAAAKAVSEGDLSVGRVLDRLRISYSELMDHHQEHRVGHHH